MQQLTERIVVKVGTSTLTYENGKLNLRRFDDICRVLSDFKNAGAELVLVTSGAIGVGVGKLGLQAKPTLTEQRQAAAAVGQCELMFMYDKFFSDYNQTVAQVLLTKNVTDNEISCRNVVNTFTELFKMNVIPVVNENDTVETAELEGMNYGDNDMLSAIVADIIQADRLFILTDTDGLYDSDPRLNPQAKIIAEVDNVTDETIALTGGPGSSRGTGGMQTKVSAAKFATSRGIHCYVTNGNEIKNLYDILEGKPKGTYFKPTRSV